MKKGIFWVLALFLLWGFTFALEKPEWLSDFRLEKELCGDGKIYFPPNFCISRDKLGFWEWGEIWDLGLVYDQIVKPSKDWKKIVWGLFWKNSLWQFEVVYFEFWEDAKLKKKAFVLAWIVTERQIHIVDVADWLVIFYNLAKNPDGYGAIVGNVEKMQLVEFANSRVLFDVEDRYYKKNFCDLWNWKIGVLGVIRWRYSYTYGLAVLDIKEWIRKDFLLWKKTLVESPDAPSAFLGCFDGWGLSFPFVNGKTAWKISDNEKKFLFDDEKQTVDYVEEKKKECLVSDVNCFKNTFSKYAKREVLAFQLKVGFSVFTGDLRYYPLNSNNFFNGGEFNKKDFVLPIKGQVLSGVKWCFWNKKLFCYGFEWSKIKVSNVENVEVLGIGGQEPPKNEDLPPVVKELFDDMVNLPKGLVVKISPKGSRLNKCQKEEKERSNVEQCRLSCWSNVEVLNICKQCLNSGIDKSQTLELLKGCNWFAGGWIKSKIIDDKKGQYETIKEENGLHIFNPEKNFLSCKIWDVEQIGKFYKIGDIFSNSGSVVESDNWYDHAIWAVKNFFGFIVNIWKAVFEIIKWTFELVGFGLGKTWEIVKVGFEFVGQLITPDSFLSWTDGAFRVSDLRTYEQKDLELIALAKWGVLSFAGMDIDIVWPEKRVACSVFNNLDPNGTAEKMKACLEINKGDRVTFATKVMVVQLVAEIAYWVDLWIVTITCIFLCFYLVSWKKW